MDEAAHKNILAIRDHSVQTREMVKELEVKLAQVDMLRAQVVQLESLVKTMLQQKGGGPTA
jgi:hypothetical protein